MKKVLLLFFASCMIFSLAEKDQKYQTINQDSKLMQSIKRGKEVYLDMCVTCHLPNGEGVSKIYPPLANSDYLLKNPIQSIRVIKYGARGKMEVNGITYRGIMAPLGLENDEVADVMNYISNSWGNKTDTMFTEEDISKVSK